MRADGVGTWTISGLAVSPLDTAGDVVREVRRKRDRARCSRVEKATI